MREIGTEELRRSAEDVVRRAEAGEHMAIVMAGRHVAVLGPARARSWRRWEHLAGLLHEPADLDGAGDRGTLDAAPADPWQDA